MSSIFDKFEIRQQDADDCEKNLDWATRRIRSLNQALESSRPEYLVDLDDKAKKLEVKLDHAKVRIAELNEVITGERPDLFHDSLVRGSRVARMEEVLSTLRTIVKYIDTADADDDQKLLAIRDSAEEAIKRNPKLGALT